jgi:DNA-binding beta-propeller fold protein YncE
VDGIAGGAAGIGTISGTGLYTAPGKAPAKHTLTIQATNTSGDRSGGSSIDVVQRETLASGLTLVTSVAYIENLQRFFIAEQQVVSSAPGIVAATTNTARISEASPSGSTSLFIEIPGDAIAKMIPFVDGATTYLLMAGFDLGKIYRLNVDTRQLATVASPPLNQPNSLALDPISGNLLVAESGADVISIIPRSQILSASEPQPPGISLRLVRTLAVKSPRGIAVDKCSGTVYVTLADGTLHEYQGIQDRIVVRGLNQPGQIQALYREGLPCADGLTLAVVEADEVSLVYPKTSATVPLLTGLQSPRDITFFPPGNPFVPGKEASVALSEAPQGAGNARVSQIAVGGIYTEAPPDLSGRISEPGRISGAYEDPEGDTFSSSTTQPPADILSVSSSRQGGSLVVTMKLKQQVDSVQGYVLLRTRALGEFLAEFAQYFPFAIDLQFNAIIDLGEGVLVSLENPEDVQVQVSNVGNTISFAIPESALDLADAAVLIILGNGSEVTDIAPNSGFLSLSP